MKKKQLKKMVRHAYNMVKGTKGIEVGFAIYADSIYILDTEEDNIIDFCGTEEEAISICQGIDEEAGYKCGCYYKPQLINAITGKRITRETYPNYLKK